MYINILVNKIVKERSLMKIIMLANNQIDLLSNEFKKLGSTNNLAVNASNFHSEAEDFSTKTLIR